MKAPFVWFGALPDRLTSKVSFDVDGCWEWTAARTNGYGVVQEVPG